MRIIHKRLVACAFLANVALFGCAGPTPVSLGVEPTLQLSVPASSVTFNGTPFLGSRATGILNLQSQALGDLSTLLQQQPAFPVADSALRQFQANGSFLLSGANAPITFNSGIASLSASNLASNVEDLRKEAEALQRQKDEQTAFLALSAPEVRALEKALGITWQDKWWDRFVTFLAGVAFAWGTGYVRNRVKPRP